MTRSILPRAAVVVLTVSARNVMTAVVYLGCNCEVLGPAPWHLPATHHPRLHRHLRAHVKHHGIVAETGLRCCLVSGWACLIDCQADWPQAA
jgi:hypothetical protein